MQKGKIILSAAALVVTAVGAFSFKSAPANTRHQLFGSFVTSGGANTVCTKVTCWTKASGTGSSAKCHTVGKVQTVNKTYVNKTTGGKCKTVSSLIKTHTN